MKNQALRVGELARRTGVSVRALHHYHHIGLLVPGRQTVSGHRLYGEAQVRRLQQIVSLRELGFSLKEIRGCLDDPDFSLQRVLELHAGRLKARLSSEQALCDRIEWLLARLRADAAVSLDDLLNTVEATTMHKHYTPQQVRKLEQRRAEVGEDRIRQVEQEWHELFEAYREAMEHDEDPAGDRVQALARRSAGLIDEFTGGDAGIEASLGRMYRQEGTAVLERHGYAIDPAVFQYMGRAMKALKK